MRKWLIIIVVVLLSASLLTTPVSAGTSDEITVTAVGYVGGGAPLGFTLTYISDYEIGMDWTKGTASLMVPPGTASTVVNTMIRVRWGSAPVDRTDGYLVYYGVADTFSDTAVDVTSLTSMPYYRAWSETVFYDIGGDIISSIWEEIGATEEANFMSLSWVFAVLGLLALGLTVFLFHTRNAMLGFPSAIFWAVFGGFCYQQSTATWDIYYLVFFAAFGMVIFTMFAAFALRTKKEELATGEEFIDEGKDDVAFIDEGLSPSENKARYDEYGNSRRPPKKADEEVVSARVQGIRDRAAARRKKYDH